MSKQQFLRERGISLPSFPLLSFDFDFFLDGSRGKGMEEEER